MSHVGVCPVKPLLEGLVLSIWVFFFTWLVQIIILRHDDLLVGSVFYFFVFSLLGKFVVFDEVLFEDDGALALLLFISE